MISFSLPGFSLLFLFLLSSCELFNPSEEIPGYIKVENPRVLIDENSGFESPLGIKDVWVYHSGGIQGVYPIPSVFPYLNVQNPALFIEGGVFESGLSSFRVPYPFWEPLSFNISQSPGDTFLIEPLFQYRPDTDINIRIDEGFEQSINFQPFRFFEGDTTTIYRANNDVFTGNWSGRVRFNADHRHFEVTNIHPEPMIIEQNRDVYAEITYKGSVQLNVGLTYRNSGSGVVPIVTIAPSSEWKTVYVHMVQQVREILAAEQFTDTWFNLWLGADGEGNEGEILLDNVRLIHFR